MSPSAINPQAVSVVIIGAGIAGVAVSIALAKENPNLQITVYEKRAGFTELGVGVGIGPNAVRAMGLITPELRRAYDGIVTLNGQKDKLNTDFDIFAGDGELRGQFLGEMLAREGIPHGGVNRIALMDALTSLLPESVEFVFGKTVEKVAAIDDDDDDHTKKGVMVSFSDGTEIIADTVIGCDGIRSKCREMIVGKGQKYTTPVFSGRYCYRAVIPMDEAVKAIGPIAQTRRLIAGHGRHILLFPVQKGKGLNMAAFVDTKGQPWTHERWLVPATIEDVQRDFSGFDESSMKLLGLIRKTEKWGLFDYLEAPTFVDQSGRFCVLGDAAHASSPHCGAGAGMAIEDAYIIAQLLRASLLQSAVDVPAALRAYDAVRRPRSQELVRRSRRQGSLFCLLLTDEHGLLPDFVENMKWVWDVDFGEMQEEAERAFAYFKMQQEETVEKIEMGEGPTLVRTAEIVV